MLCTLPIEVMCFFILENCSQHNTSISAHSMNDHICDTKNQEEEKE